MGRIAVYLRVSTIGQDLASQEPDLREWAQEHAAGDEVVWFQDTFTGATLLRPGFEALERDVRAGLIHKIVVWRLDRLGRTAAETLAFLSQLDGWGVELISIRDRFDATSPTGRLLRTILAGFAEYEREVISERIRAGISAAKARGKRWGGRKPGSRSTLTPVRLEVLRVLVMAGTHKAEIARQLGISRSTVYEGMALLRQEERRGTTEPLQAAGGS